MIYDAGAGGVGAVDLRRLEEVFGRAGGGEGGQVWEASGVTKRRKARV